MAWQQRFSKEADAVQASEIRELLKVVADPAILSFAGGIPDPALFPMDALDRVLAKIRTAPDDGRDMLQYSLSEGLPGLRQWIADRHSTPETRLQAHQVLVTAGAQQSLALLAMALIDPGMKMAVAAPTYLGALQVFGAKNPRFVAVASDEQGMIPEDIDRAFQQGARLLYVIPDFQNPDGISMSASRRAELVELAHRHGVPVIEDTAYRALYYDAPPPPSLLNLEGRLLGPDGWRTNGLVIQLGTASKTMMPGLRVGWTIAPTPLLDKMVLLKQAADLHTAPLNQRIALGLGQTVLDTHIPMLRRIYGARRDAMVESLEAHLPDGCRFTRPGGGMFVWVTLPPAMDGRRLLARAIAEEKLAFVPGGAFHPLGGGDNSLRLSFATCAPSVIGDAMVRLANVIADDMRARAA